MFSFIGLGAGGGNIADEAAKRGFHAASINFSQKDLEALEYVKFKLRLLGSDGVGHNRDIALSLIAEHHEMATTFIKQHFADEANKLIFFAFSTGGGSGSGMSCILIDLVMNLFPDKVIVAMPIIPDNTESTVSLMNTLSVFEELSHLNVCILPVDNQQIRSRYAHISKAQLYRRTNESVVNLIEDVVYYTEQHSKHGNFDTKDLLTTFRTQGLSTISQVDLEDCLNKGMNTCQKGFTQYIQQSWEESVFSPIEYKHVMTAAVIYDASEDMLENVSYSDIFDKFDTGTPVDLFEGIYHTESKITTVLTGLRWFESRLSSIEKIIEQKAESIQQSNVEEPKYKSKFSTSDLFNKVRPTPPKQQKSTLDILNKYKTSR